MTSDQLPVFDCYECSFGYHVCRVCGAEAGHGWWLCPEHRQAPSSSGSGSAT